MLVIRRSLEKNMTRAQFDQELRQLKAQLATLGSLTHGAIDEATRILMRRDMAGSRRLMAWDKQINERRYALEYEVLALIARQQPVASDTRLLAAVLEIGGELERISDYAKGIAKINLLIGPDEPLPAPARHLPPMAAQAADMLARALDAFETLDVTAARAIPLEDDLVDDLYNQVFRELMAEVIADPLLVDRANYLLWAAHNLERTADRVTNICERIVFTVTGQLGRIDGRREVPDRAASAI